MTLNCEDARERLQQHLQQQRYYLAATLLANRLIKHGYVATVALFEAAGGYELAPGSLQAALQSIQGSPEGEIIAQVLHSPYGCCFVGDRTAAGLNTTYTVGLWNSFWHPEIICVGQPALVARLVLNLQAEQIAEGMPPVLNEPVAIGGSSPEPGESASQVLFRPCGDGAKRLHMPKAVWFHGNGEFSAIQMIWPDHQQRWPWEEGVSAQDAQQLLV